MARARPKMPVTASKPSLEPGERLPYGVLLSQADPWERANRERRSEPL